MSNWYPEQREAFVGALMACRNDMPPQAGLKTQHTDQDIEYALYQIGCKEPSLRMIAELATFMLATFRLHPGQPERVYNMVYDAMIQDYAQVGGTKVGYFPVEYQDDPFHTTSGHVERELRRMMLESFPRATEIQVREAAGKIRHRLEQDPARPLDHSHDAWRRKGGKRDGKKA